MTRSPAPNPTAPTLAAILGGVATGDPLAWAGLQVFPLHRPNGGDPTCALLDDLLERGEAEVTELGEQGQVPRILVKNRSGLDALILDGMELRGAKQNRMVNVTIIVGRHSEEAVPVSCVEAGRWAYRSRQFASAKRTVGSKLRNLKAHMVRDSLAAGGPAQPNQRRVWDRVDAYVAESGARSATAALDAAFARSEGGIEDCVAHLKSIEAAGAMVALNGEIVGLDLLDHPATFGRLWELLLRGYALDAVLEPQAGKALGREDVEAWLTAVAHDGALVPHEVPGVGAYYAVRGPRIAGGTVLRDGHAVHTALFPAVA
jgi:hypothetical protein